MKQMSLFIGACFAICSSLPAQAIINGSKPSASDFLESVYLKTKTDEHCSGVIIGDKVILTAGHCAEDLVSSGSASITNQRGNSSRSIKIDKVSLHPRYVSPKGGRTLEPNQIQYDLGVIRLSESIRGKIGSALVSQVSGSDQETKDLLKDASEVLAVGYGITKRSRPGLRTSAIMDNDEKRFLAMSSEVNTQYRVILARSKKSGAGVCKGDSGSGLFAPSENGRVLVGILSGVPNDRNCGGDKSYGAYVIVSDHVCWIEKASQVDLNQDRNICSN